MLPNFERRCLNFFFEESKNERYPQGLIINESVNTRAVILKPMLKKLMRLHLNE